MRYLLLKDKKLRKHFNNLEIKDLLKKFIKINLLFFFFKNSKIDFLHKKLIFYFILKKKKKNILNKIVRRCILTNRSKSIRFLKISRIKSRELISLGIIPGYKKAVW